MTDRREPGRWAVIEYSLGQRRMACWDGEHIRGSPRGVWGGVGGALLGTLWDMCVFMLSHACGRVSDISEYQWRSVNVKCGAWQSPLHLYAFVCLCVCVHVLMDEFAQHRGISEIHNVTFLSLFNYCAGYLVNLKPILKLRTIRKVWKGNDHTVKSNCVQ